MATLKILSITVNKRLVHTGMPAHYIVGMPPILKLNEDGSATGNEMVNSPSVAQIAFPAIDMPRKVFDGGRCYIVSFDGADEKCVIPSDTVTSVTYGPVESNPSKNLPELPGD